MFKAFTVWGRRRGREWGEGGGGGEGGGETQREENAQSMTERGSLGGNTNI